MSEYLYTDTDGNTMKYTEDMIKAAITDQRKLNVELAEMQAKVQKYWLEIHNIQSKTYEFFKDRYDAGDSDITCDTEDVNDFLQSIGSERLKSLFTVSGTISFTLTDVEAEDADDAREIAERELTVTFDGDGDLSDWDVNVEDTSQQ